MTSWVAAIAYVAALGVVWFLVPYFYRKQKVVELFDTCARRRAIVLTYDDGPGEELTPRLLDLLKKLDLHATFYALGRNIEKHPELLQRTIAEGHDVGSHTFNHSNAWKTDPISAARDLVRGVDVMKTYGGDAFSFRPPYGKLTIFGLLHGYIRGLKYGWWTVDSRDSWDRRPVEDVLAEIRRNNGGVILMHDYDRYDKSPASPTHVDYVLSLTEAIANLAKQQGFRIVALSSLDW
jgi:peptidoglycan-N-acetylglucosamine deacetylase